MKNPFEYSGVVSGNGIFPVCQAWHCPAVPFAYPDHVLDYLSRYTHRVALSNNRICSVHNRKIIFTYSDRKKQNHLKLMKLDTDEFIRPFLLHVIPKGFMHVRHFGFLANRSKKHLFPLYRKLLGLNPALPTLPQRSTHELMLALTGIGVTQCPICRKGTLVFLAKLYPAPWDSSSRANELLHLASSTRAFPTPLWCVGLPVCGPWSAHTSESLHDTSTSYVCPALVLSLQSP